MCAQYAALFSPIELTSVRIKNRIVHASMTTRFGRDQAVTEQLLNYHRNRAVGGAGAIVTEPLATQPWHRQDYKVDVFRDLAGCKRWAEQVESHDCRLIGQLQESGRGRHEEGQHPHAIGPSALPDDLSWTVPRALSLSQIQAMTTRFAEAAQQLQDAGFSGVEISAGHGHLFHQFLSPWSNRRRDEYGGSLSNRLRSVAELISEIRARCGSAFIIGVKLPSDDGVANSIDLAEAARITTALAQLDGVSYFCHVHGAHALSLEDHVPDMHGPRTPYVNELAALRDAANGVPTTAIGLITDPAEADAIVASGQADLIGLGRPLVTDAAWPQKAANDQAAQIRYCVSCNNCWAAIIRDHSPIACDNNPRLGRQEESNWRPAKVKQRQHVLVIGAGVAGLEAAWVAAARGHRVTVWSSRESAGGKAELHSQLPGGENISSVYDYQIQRAQDEGVVIETVGLASAEAVISTGPDQVVLATGATMRPPSQLPAELVEDEWIVDLRVVTRQLLNHHRQEPGCVVIFDEDHTAGTYAAALHLRHIFQRVVLVTPRETVASKEALVVRQGIYRRINKAAIEIMPFHELGEQNELEIGRVALTNIYTGQQEQIDELALLTFATPRIPNDALRQSIVNAGIPVALVGDCFQPGSLMMATRQGHQVGESLGS